MQGLQKQDVIMCGASGRLDRAGASEVGGVG